MVYNDRQREIINAIFCDPGDIVATERDLTDLITQNSDTLTRDQAREAAAALILAAINAPEDKEIPWTEAE